MTLTQLRTFLAVAETGSIRAAAERLVVTQSAVSSCLAALQKDLALALVSKDGRGLRLTDAGEIYTGYVRGVLGLLDEAYTAAVGEAEGGKLRIAAVTTAGEQLLPRLLATFRRSHPRIGLLLEVGNRARVWSLVADHEVDLVLGGRPPQGPGRPTMVAHAVRPNPLIVVCAAAAVTAVLPWAAPGDLGAPQTPVAQDPSAPADSTSAAAVTAVLPWGAPGDLGAPLTPVAQDPSAPADSTSAAAVTAVLPWGAPGDLGAPQTPVAQDPSAPADSTSAAAVTAVLPWGAPGDLGAPQTPVAQDPSAPADSTSAAAVTAVLPRGVDLPGSPREPDDAAGDAWQVLDWLARQTWLLREHGSGTRATTESFLDSLELTPSTLTVGSNVAVCESAAAGLGVTLISRDAVARDLGRGALVELPTPATPLRRDWRLVSREGRLPAPARLFVQHVLRTGEFHVPGPPSIADE